MDPFSDGQKSPQEATTKRMNPISEERRVFVQQKLDEWCANGGYKDSNVNMLTLSRTLCISKNELSLFFDKDFAFSLVFYEKMVILNLNHFVLYL